MPVFSEGRGALGIDAGRDCCLHLSAISSSEQYDAQARVWTQLAEVFLLRTAWPVLSCCIKLSLLRSSLL